MGAGSKPTVWTGSGSLAAEGVGRAEPLTWLRSRSVLERGRKASGSGARAAGGWTPRGLRKVKSLPSEAGEKHVR